jgi:hypothetical protein
MIKFKAGVDMCGIRPELSLALVVCDQTFENKGVYEMVITSLKDGTHMPGSWHYSGWAADLRSKNVGSTEHKNIILEALRSALGPQWEVILESLGKPNEHFHIEPSPVMKATK